jgi:hypothetical protein
MAQLRVREQNILVMEINMWGNFKMKSFMGLVFGMIKKDRLKDKGNGHRVIEFLGFVNHNQILRD